jgi:hypothetical protein
LRNWSKLGKSASIPYIWGLTEFFARRMIAIWADLCDSVTDNFRVINPADFRVMR